MSAAGSRTQKPQAAPSAADLLAWYDRQRRSLPWRAEPGETADPYRVWLSEVMLQQTTVAAVRPYFERFLTRFPDVSALARAGEDEVMSAWAGLGYYSRARNLHACARLVAEAGAFPDTAEGLRRLPGIGAYTSGAIAAIAFGRQEAAVDGNVERVMTRVAAIETPLPNSRPEIRVLTQSLVPADRPGDFAQAVMDLGATICTPRKPACALCPWMPPCRARALGLQETFPRKVRKEKGTLRRGSAFVAFRAGDGAILLRTRPPGGLLGAMAEPPTSEWEIDYDPARALLDAPLDARWKRQPGLVRHGFTHFPLELTVFTARLALATPAPAGMRFVPPDALADEPLPGLMLKVIAHARDPKPEPPKRGRPGRESLPAPTPLFEEVEERPEPPAFRPVPKPAPRPATAPVADGEEAEPERPPAKAPRRRAASKPRAKR
ncbi:MULTISPECIES: A/G-specific adenine glycosylase [Methylobacterium]|uniref:Adenine DNA glycosylase n=1 Tax=Methylobacterium jeotgali TaxID=381630 RepID=A0ABQ4T085_9HYPH|nr:MULTISPECIES: A/G-specific adenine glycosylase [Methylobacterium]PIU04540.1 MAG: A/G-specific adenine glycosylase [Methylobacterium sp. CG09_land_8_20_14_0_10_71_15]PIU15432.1 MAG: A/G-specific adenine glycosylase [Methylobacterium sp. CG08_land_8_20_14_0_20_71_15]GBU16219.1 A/G-specific adenine glycosylase [Methylobacterium sp.]GJE08742.1 Endonuclease III [Methylobacterium jeotgali]